MSNLNEQVLQSQLEADKAAAEKTAGVGEKTTEGTVKGYKAVENGVVGGYKAIETGVVKGYQAVEDAVVGTYEKIENAFVKKFLTKEGETVEEAKKRMQAGLNPETKEKDDERD